MTHKRSLNFIGYFASGRATKQEIYRPGTLDPANLVSGRLYYGGVISLLAVARINSDKNLKLYLETMQGEFPLTDLIPFSEGIASRNLREIISQTKTMMPYKLGTDARLKVECLDTFGAGEWIVVNGVADELSEDLATV